MIDHWSDHTATVNTGSKLLEAGKWYDITLEYYENAGPAQINLRWSSAHQTGAGVFQTIPATNLEAMKATPETFSNPLRAQRNDPYVIQWNGMYYLSAKHGHAVWIDRLQPA